MDVYHYSQFPTTHSVIRIALYTKVGNAASLRERIIKAATLTGAEGDRERDAINFAFIDARLITSLLHLKTAVYQATLSASQDSLRTKTVHSEILWALNPSNNISEAIRRYGVSDTSATLFVVRIGPPELADVESKMSAVVSGTLSPFSDLDGITDWAAVKKYNKLNGEIAVKEAAGDTDREHGVVDNIVTSAVAMKSVMA
ncbi:CGI-121-domain-containing protein [Athelia psychrophila]|uniref:EKC/KEOPS complex subunit CGI121 n=1 Tax=Athelia psychrophila TaxID=1759441 RepID=A0A166CXS3_9AGAM|nr:CGI-121-domain-containing protein [Fibularhizoctonia sp. CBS 109695]